MDVQMPGVDGLAATQAIRAMPGREQLPIVAMTAQALPAQIAACRAAGMNDHLAKPITPDGLRTTIARWTSPSAAPSAAADPPDAAGDVMTQLKARFVERTREDRTRLAELLATADPAVADELHALVHRFAGTAGTFGFPDIGDRAAVLDQKVAAGQTAAPEDYAALMQAIDAFLQAA
jgi:CheY-like chemotaxis protein